MLDAGDPAAGHAATRSASSTRARWCAEPGHVRGRGRSRADHRPVRPRSVTGGGASGLRRSRSIVWLWFTVLFANFAEAVAEGRGKAQADTLRATPRPRRMAKRLAIAGDDRFEHGRRADRCKPGDLVLVEAGDLIPGDGEVDRGRRLGRRGGDHRRVGAGHPRERRRPLGRHRRHAGALRLDQGAHHRRARARPSSTA